jgi:hypothetical protein
VFPPKPLVFLLSHQTIPIVVSGHPLIL